MVDTSKLGLREVKFLDVQAIPNPNSGIKELQQVMASRMEQQPVLTPEEAKVLAEADWKESPAHFAKYGAFTCTYNGQRWFCSEKPVKAAKPKAKDN